MKKIFLIVALFGVLAAKGQYAAKQILPFAYAKGDSVWLHIPDGGPDLYFGKSGVYFAGPNYFPSLDSLARFTNRYIKNSAIEAFTNLRLNTTLNGIIQHLDSARNLWKDTLYAFRSNDSVYFKVGVSGAKVFMYKDSVGTGGGSSSTVKDSVSYVNGLKFGLTGDGSTDDASVLQTLVNTYRNIYLPKATYKIGSTITVPDSVSIWGDGIYSKLTTTANIPILSLGRKDQVKDVTFQGSGSGTSQVGILIDSVYGNLVTGCYFQQLAGAGVRITRTALVPGNPFAYGNKLTNLYGELCRYGIFFDTRGEYTTVTGCMFSNGTAGLYMSGGNNTIIGGNYPINTYGIYITGGSNNAHSVADGVQFNHNTYGVYADGVTLGYRFLGCMLYGAKTYLNNSNKIYFSNCHFDIDSILVGTAVTNSYFINCQFEGATINKNLGTSQGVTFINNQTLNSNLINLIEKGNSSGQTDSITWVNRSLNSFNINDPINHVSSSLSTINNSLTVGGTGVTSIALTKPVLFAGGSIDVTRDISAGKARFDLAATTGDGVQIYKTGSSGGSLTVLDASANYQFRAMSSGLTSLGNNTTPSAVVDITGQAATAAPLRIRSSVAPTSPNDGDIWNQSGILKFRATTSQSIVTDGNTLTLTNKTLTSPQINTPLLDASSTIGDVWTATNTSGAGHWAAPSGGGLSGTLTSGRVPYASGSSTLADNANFLWDNTNQRLSIGTTTATGGLNLGGNRTWNGSTSGISSYFVGATYNDNTTAASGTTSGSAIPHLFATPTFTATNSNVTIPLAATVYIAAPVASTNVTITANRALYVNGNTELAGAVYIKTNGATDADYTVLAADYYISLPTITAGRTITLPAASAHPGRLLIFRNKNSSGNTWQFGTAVKDGADASVTNLTNDTIYYLLSDGTDWNIIN